MFHPLGTDLSKFSDDELNKKYGELQKRITQCYKFGPMDLVPQLQMLIDDYQFEDIIIKDYESNPTIKAKMIA